MKTGVRDWLSWMASREGRYVPFSLLLLGLSLCALVIDDWACREIYHFPLPTELYDLVMFAEVCGHGMGVLAIMVVVGVLDSRPKFAVYRLACCAFGAGLAANVAKLLIPRVRPHFASVSNGVWTTFGDVRLSDVTDMWEHSLHSFPSGHAATAMGLAMGLSYCYPRGRYVFLTLAALAGLQRLVTGAHYISDVLAGAAVGCLVAGALLRRLEWVHGKHVATDHDELARSARPAPVARSAPPRWTPRGTRKLPHESVPAGTNRRAA